MFETVFDEAAQHRDAVCAPDHLRVHGDGEDAAIDALVHPVQVSAPNLKYVAGRGGAVPIWIEIELKMDPIVKLKAHGQLPHVSFLPFDERRLLGYLVAQARVIRM